MQPSDRWAQFQANLCAVDELGMSLDFSRMNVPPDFELRHQDAIAHAFEQMRQLEHGAVANPDEGRRVGHYWLRAPELAPPAEGEAIRAALAQVKTFTSAVHLGSISPPSAPRFTDVVVIGIGGSALGPQLAADALGSGSDRLALHFFDNTDPDGFDRVLERLGSRLASTLVCVISKSGGTKETRNGMLEMQAAYVKAGLSFAAQAVAVTGEGSELHHVSASWLARFPMWDWVGGRTSQLSAVGLLPAALQGFDIDALLEGARTCDAATRTTSVDTNPAMRLALLWLLGSEGRGAKALVVLPYKDRLLLLSRYLQQLVMESLGKEKDVHGTTVHQGLTVYGNKGSTDQHAYVQQLRDGVPNFFALFIEVLKDRNGPSVEVEPHTTSGDYLLGFLLGTRSALSEQGRASMTLTVPDVSARTLGALIALFERAVGFYASLIGINAYHQPGVEAGKKAAALVLSAQHALLKALDATPRGIVELASRAGNLDAETCFSILRHLAANGRITSHGRGPSATFSR
jgi:glucose-6-phosphate isomerase